MKKWRTKEFDNAISICISENTKNDNLISAAEELSELVTKLIQKVNKPDKISDDDIAEEIADVEQHLIILNHYFNVSDEMRESKIQKFLESKEFISLRDKNWTKVIEEQSKKNIKKPAHKKIKFKNKNG